MQDKTIDFKDRNTIKTDHNFMCLRVIVGLMTVFLLFPPNQILAQQQMHHTLLVQQSSLAKIHRKIEKQYPFLNHLDGDELTKINENEMLIFDVRKPAEYNVSHIDGAIQIDPKMEGQTFIDMYGSLIKDKKLVFYCSVGRRSSSMAARVRRLLSEDKKEQVFNLKSGIFRWRNENRPLMQQADETPYVHAYNPYWGRLIEDRSAIKYRPE